MARQIAELEAVLQSMIDEHRRLLAHADAQQKAMATLNLTAIEDATHRQESARLRITALDVRRKSLVAQLAKLTKLPNDATLSRIATTLPGNSGAKLLKLRDELKSLVQQLADRTTIGGKLASAVLGHLNTAMRLFAGAVGQANVYTKAGVPRVAARIGIMEAIG